MMTYGNHMITHAIIASTSRTVNIVSCVDTDVVEMPGVEPGCYIRVLISILQSCFIDLCRSQLGDEQP